MKLLTLLSMTLACIPAISAASTSEESASLRAQQATAELGKTLKQALLVRIGEAGPVGAIDFCHEQAIPLTRQVAANADLKLGRIGVRNRNPDNAAGGWQQQALASFQQRLGQGEGFDGLQWQAVSADGRHLQFARPIRTEAACLLCHGESLAPEVAQAVDRHYPQDPARGFREGELRGMVWAEVALAGADPVSTDPRRPVTMTPAQASELRAQMRDHLETLQRMLAAWTSQDWSAIATIDLMPAGARGTPHSFRERLPAEWFSMARPMHQALRAAQNAAATAPARAQVPQHIAAAMQHCNACHATFRIDEEGSAP